ncbi:g_PROTEIN_RECEP_F2_4 domain-containing protein [Caerostris extrusa]|uniref:G_PROTEIN_RECEP_F2_4 domain-containing protein n=1 Tax=Caerostris extrusa TaxID=172846 RepID=A0AAV4YCH8_CAEEX|nr:g_PROTEIN_RECEP_F2_4 domain-containing protein [Caerostris extrusa]
MNCWILRAAVAIFLWEMSCSNSIRMSSAGHRVVRSTNASQGNETTAEPVVEVDESKFRKEFLTCAKSPVECQYYEILPNKSVFVPLYNRLFRHHRSHHRQASAVHLFGFPGGVHRRQEVLVCPGYRVHRGHFHLPSSASSCTWPCSSASGSSGNLPGYCLFSLCVALLAAYVLTLLSYFHYSGAKEVDCTAVGGMKAYFFLASLFWMNVMSYDIWRSLRMATAKLRLMGDRPMLVRYAMYSAYSWGSPRHRPRRGDRGQQSRQRREIPVHHRAGFLLVLLQAGSAGVLRGAAGGAAGAQQRALRVELLHDRGRHPQHRREQGGPVVQVPGVRAPRRRHGPHVVLRDPGPLTEQSWLWYLYVLCNVLQGVFIFFSFTFTEKTRHECKKAIQGKKSSVIPTQTSSQQSTSV